MTFALAMRLGLVVIAGVRTGQSLSLQGAVNVARVIPSQLCGTRRLKHELSQ